MISRHISQVFRWGVLVCAALYLLSAVNCEIVKDIDEDDNFEPTRKRMFNFASHQAGAVIVDKSPANAKGFHHLLNEDRDKYGICRCSEKKWVVIGLSEEVAITSIAIANYERYSSMVRDFQLLGSLKYPTTEWNDLGTYTAQLMLGEQHFNVSSSSTDLAHTRYLKVKILSHYLDEDLCTLSQVKVFGMTVFATLQDEVQRSEENDIKLLLQQDIHEDLRRENLAILGGGHDNDSLEVVSSGAPDSSSIQSIETTTNGEEAVPILKSESSDTENVVEEHFPVDLESKMIDTNISESVKAERETEVDFAAPDPLPFEEAGIAIPNTSPMSTVPNEIDHQESLDNVVPVIQPLENDPTSSSEESPASKLSGSDSLNTVCTEPSDDGCNDNSVERGGRELVTIVNEAGVEEELQLTTSEWGTIRDLLRNSNLTSDIFRTALRGFQGLLLDPLSRKLDLKQIETIIFSQSTSNSTIQPTAVEEKTPNEPLRPADDEGNGQEVLSVVKNVDEIAASVSIGGSYSDEKTEESSVHQQLPHHSIEAANSDIGGMAPASKPWDTVPEETVAVQSVEGGTEATLMTHLESVDNADKNLAPSPADLTSDGLSPTNVADTTTITEAVVDLMTDTAEVATESRRAEVILEASQELSEVSESHQAMVAANATIPEDGVKIPAIDIQLPSDGIEKCSTAGLACIHNTTAPATGLVAPLASIIAVNGSSNITNNTRSSPTVNAASGLTNAAPGSGTGVGNGSGTTVGSSCLDQMKFVDFQARMMAKLQAKNPTNNSSNGNGSGNVAADDSSSSGTVAGSGSGTNSNNNNVFKQIIQRMKALETNQVITEIYLAQVRFIRLRSLTRICS